MIEPVLEEAFTLDKLVLEMNNRMDAINCYPNYPGLYRSLYDFLLVHQDLLENKRHRHLWGFESLKGNYGLNYSIKYSSSPVFSELTLAIKPYAPDYIPAPDNTNRIVFQHREFYQPKLTMVIRQLVIDGRVKKEIIYDLDRTDDHREPPPKNGKPA